MRFTHFLALMISFTPLASLARSWQPSDECPTSIKTLIPGGLGPNKNEGGSDRVKFDTMDSVHEALSSCPNITFLDLRVTLLGCSGWPGRFEFPFRLEGGDKYQPLKSLRLEGYNFGTSEWLNVQYGQQSAPSWLDQAIYWFSSGKARDYWRYSKLDLAQRSKTNLDLWLDAMDWSQLENVALLDARRGKSTNEFLKKTAPYLKSLKDLEISEGNVTLYLEFIRKLEKNTLERLVWKNNFDADALSPILESHGSSLKYLEIRTEEIMESPTPAFNASQLSLLASNACKLSHLSINMHRNGTWPLETFSTIASISSLRTADLWFDIVADCQRQKSPQNTMMQHQWIDEYGDKFVNNYCYDEDRFQRPVVQEVAALGLFKHMRENKAGEELTNVTFWVGDWTRSWDGPLYFPPWNENRKAKVVCSTKDKSEDEEDWCVTESGHGYWHGAP